MAEEPADALTARAALVLAARVIVVHVDALPLFEWLVIHAAGLVVRQQELGEAGLGVLLKESFSARSKQLTTQFRPDGRSKIVGATGIEPVAVRL